VSNSPFLRTRSWHWDSFSHEEKGTGKNVPMPRPGVIDTTFFFVKIGKKIKKYREVSQ